MADLQPLFFPGAHHCCNFDLVHGGFISGIGG
jgi:hypothetical protein